jgi:hypothetical protein
MPIILRNVKQDALHNRTQHRSSCNGGDLHRHFLCVGTTETTRISAVTANFHTAAPTNADTDAAAIASSAGIECVVLGSISQLVKVID